MQSIEAVNWEVPVNYFEARLRGRENLESVLSSVGFSEVYLKNKKTLFVGPGPFRDYPLEAVRKGLDVVFIDPAYRYFQGVVIDPGEDTITLTTDDNIDSAVLRGSNAIEGIAEALPLSNQSFDLVIAEASVPAYSVSKDLAYLSLDEMIRVLKVDGELRITPFLIDPNLARTVRESSIGDYKLPDRLKDSRDKEWEDILSSDEADYIRAVFARDDLFCGLVKGGVNSEGYFFPGLSVKRLK